MEGGMECVDVRPSVPHDNILTTSHQHFTTALYTSTPHQHITPAPHTYLHKTLSSLPGSCDHRNKQTGQHAGTKVLPYPAGISQ